MSRKVLLGTISNSHQDWLPYAAGSLISYAQSFPEIKNNFNFLEPEWRSDCLDHSDFLEKLSQADILGLSCYVWNQVTNDAISQVFKKINPNGIVLYGGPNIPENTLEFEKFKKDRSWVKTFFTGPGEKSLVEYLLADSTKEIYVGEQLGASEGTRPYTDGVFDSILERSGSISAAIETNRGCPYGCAFCDWGGQSRNRIKQFSEDIVKDNIRKALANKNISRLEILDANFGMFSRDVSYVKFIVEEKKRLGKEMLLTFAGLAKNGSPHLVKIMNLVLDNFSDKYRNIKLSFQTLTPKVLENVQRSNISSEKLLSITEKMDRVVLNSELIIGLPRGDSSDMVVHIMSAY